MLIFALDLEEVKEVRARGVDLDQVFRRMSAGGRQGGDSEFLGSGDILADLYCFHDGRRLSLGRCYYLNCRDTGHGGSDLCSVQVIHTAQSTRYSTLSILGVLPRPR